jgi:hypothetical protein
MGPKRSAARPRQGAARPLGVQLDPNADTDSPACLSRQYSAGRRRAVADLRDAIVDLPNDGERAEYLFHLIVHAAELWASRFGGEHAAELLYGLADKQAVQP